MATPSRSSRTRSCSSAWALLPVVLAGLPIGALVSRANAGSGATNKNGLLTQPLAGQAERVFLGDGQGGRLPVGRGQFRQVRSMLNDPGPLIYGQYHWRDTGSAAGKIWIRVDTGTQTLSVFRDGDEIGSSVILYGANGAPTPGGHYRVLERIADHRSSTYQADMPYTLRLTADGVAIHGSTVVRGAATHGCIGVPTDFARHLFAVTHRGDEVFILPDPAVPTPMKRIT